jgi:hypothetical protein
MIGLPSSMERSLNEANFSKAREGKQDSPRGDNSCLK